jgi:hypothetical protein
MIRCTLNLLNMTKPIHLLHALPKLIYGHLYASSCMHRCILLQGACMYQVWNYHALWCSIKVV